MITKEQLDSEITRLKDRLANNDVALSGYENDTYKWHIELHSLALRGLATMPMPIDRPTKPGFYWARWHTKAPGTADMLENPSGTLEVVDVFVNCVDPDDDEYLRVHVPGVGRGQPVENFTWIAEVPALESPKS